MQDFTAISNLRVLAIPRLAAAGRWRVEAMRSLSEPCLLWFTKGQGRITVQGTTRGYTAHNVVFIPPGVMHGFDAGPSVFGTAVFFGRNSTLPLPAQPQHLRIRESHAQHEINTLLDSITREMNSDIPAHDRATSHYVGLLGVWLERQINRAEPETLHHDAPRRLAARYATLLEREFRSGLGVADFAAKLNVTPTHLSRCCKQACGKPASVLLQDRRIFEAQRLLAETKIPVGHIAASLGFASPAYFTRAFHHLTGKSPTAFRRAA
ncbi:helix-turn-helix transcriptional regulator [Xinfangfangia sp. D13-10-4-6]|uniref:AraC family transcriptional regulator n=1 Tax=Pseudogemmobacter hezensis TaxID=2737662 RepID=UPI0015543A74|nr:AraC family transcriptional regulator [Pseudogemmobacter hezensis]NPD15971.1 helix-turn-helix transcriptional regulator [Pseudogemmobacter hezensis]